MAEARGLGPRQCEFDSHRPYMIRRHVALSQLRLSHDDVGATLNGKVVRTGPSGYRIYEKAVCIGYGLARWEFAAHGIEHWELKTRSGFTVETEHGSAATRVERKRRYWLVAHVGPFRVREPVEVVSVVDERATKGYAYGTLAGHPISGEEAFVVDLRADDSVWLTIRSVSRPGAGLWWLLYPVLLAAQRLYRRRYLRALAGPI
jgi:uncharacterized protein (UPF0548 family)